MVKSKAIYIEDDLHKILREMAFNNEIYMTEIVDRILRKELIKGEPKK